MDTTTIEFICLAGMNGRRQAVLLARDWSGDVPFLVTVDVDLTEAERILERLSQGAQCMGLVGTSKLVAV